MEGKESVGENGKTISCLQFAGNCAEALEIYKVKQVQCLREVFGVTKRHVYKTPDDRYVIHASVMFDDQVMIMALDDALAMKNFCTQRPGLHDCTLDDIQPTLSKALEKGSKQVSSMMIPSAKGPSDMIWGDTCVTLQDPYGHLWVLGQKDTQEMDSLEMEANEKAWMALFDGL